MSGDKPPEPDSPLRARRRLPFEPIQTPMAGAAQRGGLFLIAVLCVICAGLAVYMGFVDRRPLTSVYVIAPAVGAVWFALRLFMMITPKR